MDINRYEAYLIRLRVTGCLARFRISREHVGGMAAAIRLLCYEMH